MPTKQRYQEVAVGDLKEHPRNPNKGDVEAIRESIRENDFYGAVIVQKSTGYIIAGNHRWKAAQAEGRDKVPAIFVDCDDARAMKILLADNATARLATMDEAVELELLEHLGALGVGIEGTGYDEADVKALQKVRRMLQREPREFTQIYALNVVCEDEADQARKFEKLSKAGWDVRVVVA